MTYPDPNQFVSVIDGERWLDCKAYSEALDAAGEQWFQGIMDANRDRWRDLPVPDGVVDARMVAV